MFSRRLATACAYHGGKYISFNSVNVLSSVVVASVPFSSKAAESSSPRPPTSFIVAKHPFSIEGAPLRDTTNKPEDVFAVFKLLGTQYKATLVTNVVVVAVGVDDDSKERFDF